MIFNDQRQSELRGIIPFPKPGDYRLDITADENKIPSMYSYCIEVQEKQNG